MANKINSDLIRKNILEDYVKTVKLDDEKKQQETAKQWLDWLTKTTKLEKEKSNYINFYQEILVNLLGYSNKNLNFEEQNVEWQILDDNGKTIGCFELKGTVSDLREHQDRKEEHATPLLQTKDYCGKNGWRYGICTNYNDFILFDVHRGWSKEYEFNFESILQDENKLKEFVGIFSRKNLVQKKQIDELGQNSMDVEEEIENEFYDLFHRTRLMLMEEIRDTAKISTDEAKHYGQLYLNRLIFLFFVEDNGQIRGDFFKESVMQALESPSITELTHKISQEILGLFELLRNGSKIQRIPKFNGGLFAGEIPPEMHFLDLRDKKYHNKVYLKEIHVKDLKLTEKEKRIFEKYSGDINPIILNLLKMARSNFDGEITVDILGHIFEQSLTDLEEVENSKDFEAKLKAKKSKIKRDAIYYTPDYITSYICRNTIIPYLSKSGVNHIDDLIQEYSEDLDKLTKKIKTLKILDPACGSGAFLLKAAEILLIIDTKIQMKKNPGQKNISTMDEFTKNNEISQIIQKNIYGVDINSESVEITKLSMFLRLVHGEEQLIDLSGNIIEGNSLVSEPNITKHKVFDWKAAFSEITKDGGFDIIIGNPPYGADLTKIEQKYFKKKFEIGSTDTAQLFMKLSYDLLKFGGFQGFIVPKAFIYADNWKGIRDYLVKDLHILVDAGKVWKNVKLEQAVYVIKKGLDSTTYMSGKRTKEYLDANYKIEKKKCNVFDFLISMVSKDEIKLGEKIFNNSERLKKYISNSRGDANQKFAKETKGTTTLGGMQIQRYHLRGIKGYMKQENIIKDISYVEKNSVLAQRIVAHIGKPIDHVKITATIPEKDDFIIVDTINQLKITDKSISPYFVLGLINSKLVNWYAYRFIYGKAIRTMQFDNPVTNRIPIVVKQQDKVEKCTKKLIQQSTLLLKTQQDFEANLKAFLKIDKLDTKMQKFHELEIAEFSKSIEKIMGKELSPKAIKEWLEIFTESKESVISLVNKISNLENELNQLFFEIFELSKEEIKLIESTTPE